MWKISMYASGAEIVYNCLYYNFLKANKNTSFANMHVCLEKFVPLFGTTKVYEYEWFSIFANTNHICIYIQTETLRNRLVGTYVLILNLS